VVAAHPGRLIPAVPPTAARAARQGLATMPTLRHAEAPAAGARHAAEPSPRLEPHLARSVAPVAPHQVSRLQSEQRSAPIRHLVGPTAPRPAIEPHIARSAAPTRHLMMTVHPAFRPQPHSAAVPHFAAAPHPAAPPHFAAAPRPAAAPHFAAAPVGGARGSPPGRHR
jgi:hypothetical protein